MAAQDNPFYVAPANPLAALMQGVQGYDRASTIRKQNEQEDTLNVLSRMMQGGNIDYNQVAGLFAKVGQFGPAMQAIQAGQQQRTTQGDQSLLTGGVPGAPAAPQRRVSPPGFAPPATPVGFAPPAGPEPGTPADRVAGSFSDLPAGQPPAMNAGIPPASDPTMTVHPRTVAQANPGLLPPAQTGPVPGVPVGSPPQSAANPSLLPPPSDPTLGGLVPQQWTATGRSAGEYARTLRAAAASPNRPQNSSNALLAQAAAIDKAIQHRNEVQNRGDTVGAQIGQRRQQVIAQGMDPSSPDMRTYILTGRVPRDEPLSATDRRAIQQADDSLIANRSAIEGLREAIKLNNEGRIYEGFTAGYRAWIGNNMPDRVVPDFIASPKASEDTSNFENLVVSQALTNLKAIFGGQPTEGERKILLDIQASIGKPKAVRQEVLNRALRTAEARLDLTERRAQELRGGTYYGAAGMRGRPPPSPAATPAATPEAPRQTVAAPATPAGGNQPRARNPQTGQVLIFNGQAWVPEQ